MKRGTEPSGGLSQVFQHVGFPPFSVLEQGAERQSDLPVLIAFGAGRERAGVSQNIALVLNKFRVAIERMIWRQCASKRRHDATCLDTPSSKCR